jgi:hypothetical protein
VSLRLCRASRHSSSPGEEGEIGCRSIDSPPAPRHAIIFRRCFRARVTRAPLLLIIFHLASGKIRTFTFTLVDLPPSGELACVGSRQHQPTAPSCTLQPVPTTLPYGFTARL